MVGQWGPIDPLILQAIVNAIICSPEFDIAKFDIPKFTNLYYWRQYLHESQNVKRVSWYWPRSFIPTGLLSWWYKVLYTLLEKKKVVIELTQLWTLQVTIMTSLARHAHCCKSGLNIMGVTNHSLIRCKFFSRRWHSYLALLLSQKPVIRHIISRPHPFFSRLEVVSEDGKIVGVRTGGWVQEHSVLQT